MSTKTPSPIAQTFYEKWDEIISAWLINEQELNKLMDEKQSLSIWHIPEPYYGNIDNCSIVIIESPKGSRVLCTWSSGSNKAPSDNFGPYERDVLLPLM